MLMDVMAKFFRCGNCDLNFQPLEDYVTCPQCLTPTAEMRQHGAEIMTEHESASFASHAAFARHLRDETPTQRRQRRQRWTRRDEERALRLPLFATVIEGAGFQPWERQIVAELEARFVQAEAAA